MNRSKRIYTLLGVLAVVCLAVFAVTYRQERKEEIKNSEEVILRAPEEEVQSLSWECGEHSFAFHKEDGWIYDEDENFPVDEEKISNLLKHFQELGVSFVIEDVEDYAQYGLENPACTIHLGTEKESYEIRLGNYSDMDSLRYASIGDGKAYLLKEDPMNDFDVQLSDLIDQDETPSIEQAKEIRFKGQDSYTIAYEEDSADTYREDDVYFTRKDGKNQPLDTEQVSNYLDTIEGLQLTDYVTYHATDEELSKYGLNEPELTVEVKYTGEDEKEKEQTFSLQVSRDPEERKENAEDEDEEEEITAYARVGDSPIIYQITGEDYKSLMSASYDDLRHREVLPADFADVSRIDVTLEGKDYSITSEKKGKERVYSYQDKEIEADDLKKALTALKADSFTAQKPEQKEEIFLTVYLDKEKEPQITIGLYRYDGSFCLAVVDGQPVALVPRSQAVDLIEAVNAVVLEQSAQ